MKKFTLLLLLFSPLGFADTVVGDFRLSVVTDEVPGARQMAETQSINSKALHEGTGTGFI